MERFGHWVTGCRPIRVQRFESIAKERGSFQGSKEGRKEGRKSAAEPISSAANFWDEKDFSAFREAPPQQSRSGKGTRERKREKEREKIFKPSTKARFLISL